MVVTHVLSSSRFKLFGVLLLMWWPMIAQAQRNNDDPAANRIRPRTYLEISGILRAHHTRKAETAVNGLGVYLMARKQMFGFGAGLSFGRGNLLYRDFDDFGNLQTKSISSRQAGLCGVLQYDLITLDCDSRIYLLARGRLLLVNLSGVHYGGVSYGAGAGARMGAFFFEFTFGRQINRATILPFDDAVNNRLFGLRLGMLLAV